ncbi:MAG: hypothetical protein QOJ73_6296 [Streptosporangiaceae bacterium]|jgi:hypothetical protein|nr:hypothetical protein [Streptosporangiaceae bacterium]
MVMCTGSAATALAVAWAAHESPVAPGHPARKRLLADVRPLRESPAFRRLQAGTSLLSVSGAMTGFVLMPQVYDLTHSSEVDMQPVGCI